MIKHLLSDGKITIGREKSAQLLTVVFMSGYFVDSSFFSHFLTKIFQVTAKNRWKASIIIAMFPGAVGKIRSEIPLFVSEPAMA